MTPETIAASLLFGVPAILGLRATYRLWRIVLYDGETRRNRLLRLLAGISTIITAAALWFGVLVLRRVLGFDALPTEITGPVGLVLAALVLLVPAAIERLVVTLDRASPSKTDGDPAA